MVEPRPSCNLLSPFIQSLPHPPSIVQVKHPLICFTRIDLTTDLVERYLVQIVCLKKPSSNEVVSPFINMSSSPQSFSLMLKICV